MSAPRVLVLRALGLGDLLTAVPALRALRRAYPGHRLVLAAPEALRPAVTATGTVDELLPTTAPLREVPTHIPWTGPPPALAVDLHGCGPDSAAPLRALRPGALLAYADASGPAWDEGEHERARWCRLLTWHGIPADPTDFRIPPPTAPSPAPGAVILHPGADAAARRWPPDRFATVGAALHQAGHRVVVTGSRTETALTRQVAQDAGLPDDTVLADIPFPTLTALVASARAVVVGDTGIAHLATALGTPSVVLFGPVSPALWGPPQLPHHRTLWHPDNPSLPHPGNPHATTPDPFLLRITPPEVLTALDTATLSNSAPRPH
ncbi:glycosyltransferase family 9 protein [Streptomyces sp. NPDC049879]|uniref:glycosyltransferase family 9 protein n=1 Tax=Streptomyces sp. NPDC049879 TaxID=3365598 RepID=UPI00379F8B27